MNIESIESNVRSYCRSFPIEFVKAFGSTLESTCGRHFIDFLSGCGSLNYGHNHPFLRDRLTEYISNSGISISLDLETQSKSNFIEAFSDLILKPRNFDYKLQFTGPTGTNAVEAAIKLARKVTGRTNVVSFTNAFHGCTLGALALTGNQNHRQAATSQLINVSRFAYDGYHGMNFDTSEMLAQMLSDQSSGIDEPAAVILEIIQGEGGLNVATKDWLTKVASITKEYGALLIVDEIQTGCGRSGTFFAFEPIGLKPDIILLAKSLSGYGLPMSLVLISPEWDDWLPGEHNGTFRGNNLAFVTASAALEHFWRDDTIVDCVRQKGQFIATYLNSLAFQHGFTRKGIGMMQGVETGSSVVASNIRKNCFDRGLVLETSGPNDSVIKLMPPLNIEDQELEAGLSTLSESINVTLPPHIQREVRKF